MTTDDDTNTTTADTGGDELSTETAIRTAQPRPLLGTLALLMAATWLYGTWFPMGHFIRKELLWLGFSMVDMSQLFPPPPDRTTSQNSTAWRSPTRKADDHPSPGPPQHDAEPPPSPEMTLQRLAYVQYAWMAIMTTVGCWLALTGGAYLGGWSAKHRSVRAPRFLALTMFAAVVTITWKYWPDKGEGTDMPAAMKYAYAAAWALLAWFACVGAPRRRAAGTLAIGLIAVVGYGVILERIYPKGEGIPLFAWPALWFSVMVVAAILGDILSSHSRSLATTAIVLLLISCAATSAAICYADRLGGFVTYTPTFATYAIAIALQSAFAWILLLARLIAAPPLPSEETAG